MIYAINHTSTVSHTLATPNKEIAFSVANHSTNVLAKVQKYKAPVLDLQEEGLVVVAMEAEVLMVVVILIFKMTDKTLAQKIDFGFLMLNSLPEFFVPQGDLPDCVARAFATAIYLLSDGDMDEYNLALGMAYYEARSNGTEFSKDGISPFKFEEFLGNSFNIETITPNALFTNGIINSYINNNLPVITCIDTEIDTPYKVQGVHSITIVASDNNYYYCAYGGTDVVRIPHSAIGIYPLYVTTGLK